MDRGGLWPLITRWVTLEQCMIMSGYFTRIWLEHVNFLLTQSLTAISVITQPLSRFCDSSRILSRRWIQWLFLPWEFLQLSSVSHFSLISLCSLRSLNKSSALLMPISIHIFFHLLVWDHEFKRHCLKLISCKYECPILLSLWIKHNWDEKSSISKQQQEHTHTPTSIPKTKYYLIALFIQTEQKNGKTRCKVECEYRKPGLGNLVYKGLEGCWA